jgi:hypothetical protein
VHLFRPSLGFLTEARPRHIKLNFLGDCTNYKAKEIIGKITNLFCIYVFQIDTFINRYMLRVFSRVFFISLSTKRQIYNLQYNYLFT